MGRKAVKPILKFKDMYVFNGHQAKKQYALSFDGDNDYVNVPDISYSGAFSFEVVIKKDDAIGTIIQSLLNHQNTLIYFGYNDFRLFANNVNIGEGISNFPTIPNNVYYSLCVTFGGDKIGRYYHNGQFIFASPEYPSYTPTLNGIKIGAGWNFLKADFKDMRIWNTVRTAQQIQENMNKKLTGSELGLVAYYDFSEGVGDTLFDKSPNANHGTIYGATWVEL